MLSEEQIQAHRAAFGRIKYVTYNGVDLVFRKPKRVEVQQHAAKANSEAERHLADEQLAQMLVVQCGEATGVAAKPAFLALIEEYPYVAQCKAVGTAIAVLTGVVQDEEAKL